MIRQGKAGVQRIRSANLVPGDIVEVAGEFRSTWIFLFLAPERRSNLLSCWVIQFYVCF